MQQMPKDNQPDSRKHGIAALVLKYTALFGSVQGLAMLCTLVLTRVKSMLLGPAGFGLSEGLNSTTELIRSSTSLGVASTAVRQVSLYSDADDRSGLDEMILVTRSWALLTALAGMAACVLLSGVLSRYAFSGDSSFTCQFMLMSLSVAASAVAGGEMAVLKGTRRLGQVAWCQLLAGICSLVVTVPLYYFMQLDGVAPALALSGVATMAVTCCFSFPKYRYRACPFNRNILGKGLGMIGFGVFFTIAAFFSSWARSYIAKFLTAQGGGDVTGIYAAGYMLVTYFTTLLLSVTDNEYYPRLSAAGDDRNLMSVIATSQSQAMSMLAAPLIMVFSTAMPVIVAVVLESDAFHDAIALAQLAAVGLMFKSIYQPVAYIALARQDSVVYLAQEFICYVLLAACVPIGFKTAGLVGIGMSLGVWELLYLVMVVVVARFRYGFSMPFAVVRQILVQVCLVAICTTGCVAANGIAGYVMCGVSLLLSSLYSLSYFKDNSGFGFFAKSS